MFGDRPQDRPNVQLEREFDRPLTPRERAAVRTAVKIASRGAAARRRKEDARQRLAAKIRSGEYVSPADLKKAQAAGVNFGTRGIVGKAVQHIVEDVENAPGGVYQLGKAAALDTQDISRGLGGRKGGDLTPNRTAKVARAVGEGTVESFRHPLRRPGDTLLNLLAGYGAIAGGVSRVAAAANAAKLAERGAARAALTRPGYEGGSLLHRPTPGPRVHTVGGLPVRGKYSASPGIRSVQRAKDRIIEGSERPLAEAYTVRRAGKELGQNRRVAIAAKRGPAGRLAAMGKRLTKPQQMALRLWGKNVTVDEQIAKHTRDLAKATSEKARRNLRHRIALAEAARPYMEGSDLSKSFPVPRKKNGRRGASPKEMRKVALQADRVAGKKPGGRERALLEAGLITPEQMEFRINAPGRLDLGAEWTTAAEHAVQRLSEIEGERTAIRKGAEQTIPARTEITARPRTREEAEGLLAKLDDAVNPLIDQLANAMRNDVPKPGKVQDNFTYFTQTYGKKLGAYLADLPHEDRIREGFGREIAGRGQKAREQNFGDVAARMIAEATGAETDYSYPLDTLLALRDTLKESGVDPDALGAAIRKQDELRKALDPDIEEIFGGAQRERDFGNVETKTTIPEQRVPGEIDDEGVARLAELDRQEQQAFEELDRGDELTLTGAEEHRGRIRVPDVPTKEARPSFVGSGVYRGGQPRKPGSLSKSYRGQLEQSGGYKVNTTRNIALSALEAHRYTNVLDLRQKVLAAGVKQRPADTKALQWVPVREKALTDKQRRQLREAGPVDEHEAALEVAGGEKARVEQENARWAAFLEDIFPEEEMSGTPVGAEVKNVVWVPRQLLANMNKPFARSPFAGAIAALDTALNLVKFGVIPLKAAYVTANAVGNALFNVFQQGVFLPRNWKQAATLVRDKRTGPVLREIMESGGLQSLVGGNPKGLGVLNKGMHAYANVLSEAMLEPMMRVSSFVHEARRFGYKSNAQIYRLLTDPDKADDLAEISRRGKDAIVDYDRMGPMEKAVARRALFIYPWVKGATVYGGQFLLEHPVQSGVIGAIGNEGRVQS
ncbi:MAG TPA: hypothetical protein VFH82_04050, partial [Gemmatimonadota bacterium]|nr:hypothetical protein [Gemmatimonadota bacterium]